MPGNRLEIGIKIDRGRLQGEVKGISIIRTTNMTSTTGDTAEVERGTITMRKTTKARIGTTTVIGTDPTDHLAMRGSNEIRKMN